MRRDQTANRARTPSKTIAASSTAMPMTWTNAELRASLGKNFPLECVELAAFIHGSSRARKRQNLAQPRSPCTGFLIAGLTGELMLVIRAFAALVLALALLVIAAPAR